jgi:hypothetical protein
MTVVRMTPGILDRARATVTPTLQRAVARLVPELRHPVEYHFGWRDTDGRPCSADAGKGVRAGLALLSAEAAGSTDATALPAAAAVELVHAFSLLHDDIVDDDHQRHHRPTVWSVFGVGVGIIAGDALLALAEELLLDGGGPHGAVAAARLTEATRAMIAGQAADMAFERRNDVSLEECVAPKARPARCSAAPPPSAPSSPAPTPPSPPSCGASARSSAWPSRRPTTCSVSGVTPTAPASRCGATSGSGRRRCRSPPP